MRTIKFRGKCVADSKYAGQWVYGGYSEPQEDCKQNEGLITIYLGGSSTCKYHVIPNTVGQFTGLHDKNGKEIYGGDIVKHTLFDFYDNEEQHKSVVEYCDRMAAFFVKLSEDSDCGNYLELGLVYQEDNEIEVIGNIHDNPELLKTTNY
jgi:uncharacterized phage protein (TIGR01671 family)